MKTFAIMAVTAASLMMAANAGTSLTVRGMAPTGEGGFVMRQTTVDYGDLNIATRQGATTLLKRIRDAAHQTCATDGLMFGRVKHEVDRCRAKVTARAIADAHSPEVTKLSKAI